MEGVNGWSSGEESDSYVDFISDGDDWDWDSDSVGDDGAHLYEWHQHIHEWHEQRESHVEILKKRRLQIESDDPDITELKITDPRLFFSGNVNDVRDCDYLPFDGDWERDGNSIGENTRLRKISVCIPVIDNAFTEQEYALFFRGFATNNSIQMIDLSECKHFQGKIFTSLTPFFVNNKNFTQLVFESTGSIHSNDIHLLAAALSEFNSLRELTFSSYPGNEKDDAGAELIQSLSGHDQLQKLVIAGDLIGMNASAALVDLIKKPKSQLKQLSIGANPCTLGDKAMAVLGDGLSKNSSIESLDLSYNDSSFFRKNNKSERGWAALFGPSCNTNFITINLSNNWLDDETITPISRYLKRNKSLKNLDISGNPDIESTGWRTLFDNLQVSKLENLDLTRSRLRDDDIMHLSNCLCNGLKLKGLVLSKNPDITIKGWEAFFSLLRNPDVGLEDLELKDNWFQDEIVFSLRNCLVDNNTLKKLGISDDTGFEKSTLLDSFAMVLARSSLPLQRLEVNIIGINDTTLLKLTPSLSLNKNLKELDLYYASQNISTAAWNKFSLMLCNNQSIETTYSSNHTLGKICDGDNVDLPNDVCHYLELNKNAYKFDVARHKIIITHLRGKNYSMEPFIDMPVGVMPYAIAWMGGGCSKYTIYQGITDKKLGRETGATNGVSLFYLSVYEEYAFVLRLCWHSINSSHDQIMRPRLQIYNGHQ